MVMNMKVFIFLFCSFVSDGEKTEAFNKYSTSLNYKLSSKPHKLRIKFQKVKKMKIHKNILATFALIF
jgi:hypothetical protein